MSCSEFHVNAQAEDRDRAAVSVVTRTIHELVVQADEERLCEARLVVDLEDRLGAVAEPSIPQDKAQTPGGQVVAVRAGESVHHDRCGDGILGALPPGSLQAESGLAVSVDFRERKGFRSSVVPAQAQEGAE